jgi:hypothetical protein
MGLRSRLVVALGAVMMLLAFAPVAGAIVLEPPGKAGANQYSETIPTAGGNTTPPQGAGTPPAGGGTLATLGRGRAGEARLARRGSDGRAAAALAAATAPPGTATPPNARTSSNAAANAVLAPHSNSPLSTILRALTGSDNGGIGALLPLLLAATLAAVVGLRVWTRRQRTDTPDLGT